MAFSDEIAFVYDDKEFASAIKGFASLHRDLMGMIEKTMRRFAGTFRRNVYDAIVRNAGWASKYWQPLQPDTLRKKKVKKFFYKTGFLSRNLKPNANDIRVTKGFSSAGEMYVNLFDGLIKNVYYPMQSSASESIGKGRKGGSSRPVTTNEVMSFLEFGTKNIPARPVVQPAFWRTIQMTDLGDDLSKQINKKLARIV